MALMTSAAVSAQETYENAKLLQEDLNGTARYVGMGGALDALGADISTISTNPAGIGLFRHSSVNVSFGVVSQEDGRNFANGNKTNMSFDQIGFVYSRRVSNNSFINFAFNYHKSKNFDYILSAAGRLDNNSSQNKLSYLKSQDNCFNLVRQGSSDVYAGNSNMFSQTDYLYTNALLPVAGTPTYINGYLGASSFAFDRAHTGYIGTYDFNLSGNINDRVYLGLTFGIHDVNYKGYSEYSEALVSSNTSPVGSTRMTDDRKITGTGFDIKAGVIIRPIEDNPFRFGISVATPTWYDLTTSNYSTIDNSGLDEAYRARYSFESSESYNFKLYTPWKFGINLGTTVSNFLAVGASYEYADYSSTDTRVNDGVGYDWYYDEYYTSSSSDREMNRHTENTLKGVSTFKLGLEIKPDDNLAVRVGYNYVSPIYKKNAYKDSSVNSPAHTTLPRQTILIGRPQTALPAVSAILWTSFRLTWHTNIPYKKDVSMHSQNITLQQKACRTFVMPLT